jgi:hypothetical protein
MQDLQHENNASPSMHYAQESSNSDSMTHHARAMRHAIVEALYKVYTSL